MKELNGLKIDITRLYNLADELLMKYKLKLEQIDADVTGNLKNTATYHIDLKGTTITLYFDLARYWEQIEFGRKKNQGKEQWPDPEGDIERWLRIKIESGKFMPLPGKALPRTDEEIKEVSWNIVRKICKHGYDRTGDKFRPLLRTIDSNYGILEEFALEVAKAIGDDVLVQFQTLNNLGKARINQKIKTR